MTGADSGRASRKRSGRGADSGASELQRRVENLTRPVKPGRGKILTLRQLRRMNSVVAKRLYKDATGEGLNARDRKQGAVGLAVATDKLIALSQHDKGHGRIEHDGDPSQLAAIQDLALRLAEVGRTPKAENTHSPTKPKR